MFYEADLEHNERDGRARLLSAAGATVGIIADRGGSCRAASGMNERVESAKVDAAAPQTLLELYKRLGALLAKACRQRREPEPVGDMPTLRPQMNRNFDP